MCAPSLYMCCVHVLVLRLVSAASRTASELILQPRRLIPPKVALCLGVQPKVGLCVEPLESWQLRNHRLRRLSYRRVLFWPLEVRRAPRGVLGEKGGNLLRPKVPLLGARASRPCRAWSRPNVRGDAGGRGQRGSSCVRLRRRWDACGSGRHECDCADSGLLGRFSRRPADCGCGPKLPARGASHG